MYPSNQLLHMRSVVPKFDLPLSTISAEGVVAHTTSLFVYRSVKSSGWVSGAFWRATIWVLIDGVKASLGKCVCRET